MDGHKDSIAVAYGAQDHGAEVMYLGAIGTRPGDLDQMIRTRQANAKPLIFVYEAGPCGSGLDRYCMKKGCDCWVVAPSLIPQTPGDRVTTDRRDAVPLARLARSGDRTAVSVPPVEDEARRDRTRAREAARSDRTDAKFRLKACWLRQDIRSVGRANGGPAHLRWLSEVVCPPPAQPRVFQADVRAVHEQTDRLQRLAQARQEHVQAWRWNPGVEALQAWRGVPCTVAVTLVSAMGDRTRVEHPRALRKVLGLMPSEDSSGAPRRQGAMTTAGNPQARRALVEGAWAYRSPAQVSRPLHLRLDTPPNIIQDISGNAQLRRCHRYRRLVSRGTPATVVPVAIARELAGFMGAMATEVPVTPSDQQIGRIHPSTQKVPHLHRHRRRPGVGSPSAA